MNKNKDYLRLGIFTGWTLNLVILKYYGLIATSWLWVFSPIWVPLLLVLLLVLFGVLFDIIISLVRVLK